MKTTNKNKKIVSLFSAISLAGIISISSISANLTYSTQNIKKFDNKEEISLNLNERMKQFLNEPKIKLNLKTEIPRVKDMVHSVWAPKSFLEERNKSFLHKFMEDYWTKTSQSLKPSKADPFFIEKWAQRNLNNSATNTQEEIYLKVNKSKKSNFSKSQGWIQKSIWQNQKGEYVHWIGGPRLVDDIHNPDTSRLTPYEEFWNKTQKDLKYNQLERVPELPKKSWEVSNPSNKKMIAENLNIIKKRVQTLEEKYPELKEVQTTKKTYGEKNKMLLAKRLALREKYPNLDWKPISSDNTKPSKKPEINIDIKELIQVKDFNKTPVSVIKKNSRNVEPGIEKVKKVTFDLTKNTKHTYETNISFNSDIGLENNNTKTNYSKMSTIRRQQGRTFSFEQKRVPSFKTNIAKKQVNYKTDITKQTSSNKSILKDKNKFEIKTPINKNSFKQSSSFTSKIKAWFGQKWNSVKSKFK